jgi:exodeoxyribonuclease V alpha subunit
MTNIMHLNQVVQIKKVRNYGFATVDLINNDGSIRKRDKTLVVKFPDSAVEAANIGSLWRISGQESATQFVVNDFTVHEYTLNAGKIKYLKPSGKILSRWISSNVTGIGSTIANSLIRLEGLSDIVQKEDRETLQSVAGMSSSRVDRLIEHWPDDHLYEVIEWLEAQQLPLGLGHKLIDVFGCDALDKIKMHPFLLMAMGASFDKTMEVSKALGLTLANDAVLAGVAQHVAVAYSSDTGSTVIDQKSLIYGCRKTIDSEVPENIGEIAVASGLLAKVHSGYQVYGAAIMETSVAAFLTDCLNRPAGKHALLASWERFLTMEKISKALSEYETKLGFALTDEQSDAIKGAVMSLVCGISGGAGTGKTTILKAVIGVYEIVSDALPIYQVALSGRAAQRMSESTGLPAQSIAKLIGDHIGHGKPELPSHLLMIIDEASMVDLLSMYKLVGILPLATRIIFVGDTEQLPPVGSGLIFHSLTDTLIPFFNLSQVKRQDDESAIHKFAMSIRNDSLLRPEECKKTLAESSDCVLEESESIERLIEIWSEAGGIKDSIVLSPVRKGKLGVNNINKKLQEYMGSDRLPLCYSDDLRGWIPWMSSSGELFLQGDPVLVIKNNYDEDADLRNGDLGIIDEVFDEPDENGCIGNILVNNNLIGISSELLMKMALGYAITVHKSQGSQWNTCIVTLPKQGLTMTDKTLIYTAATRPTERLVLMGDFKLVNNAVDRGSIALQRRTNLKYRLAQAMNSYSLN